MTYGIKMLGWGYVVAWCVVACSPSQLSLGDEPVGEAGESGSVLQNTSGAGNSGGTAHNQPGGAGGMTPAPVGSGGATPVPPITGGAGSDDDCYAPQHRPELSLEAGAEGCACNGDQAECVRFAYQGRPHDMALYCIDGRWALAEDGVCNDIEAECRVRGVDYPSNSRRIEDVFSCNRCDCVQGTLGSCTAINCPIPCPDGTWAARRCVECGTGPGGCGIYETGCFADTSCQDGHCDDGAVCY
jgi:hypothetical protein